MTITSSVNQYYGVNAHLMSYFQAHGGWDGFHNMYVSVLTQYLTKILPIGYLVGLEQSLQIRVQTPDGEQIRNFKPDAAIYELTPSQGNGGLGAATITQSIAETFAEDPDLYYTAVIIYAPDDETTPGKPVTRIELLSPTNKRGVGYTQYIEKRLATLKSQTYLVEIDFLHETPSPIEGIPRYPHSANSKPYSITISVPFPSFEEGMSHTYLFGVDEKIPTLKIPIGEEITVNVDFDTIFQQSFSSVSLFTAFVDYEKQPKGFDRYSPADQKRINARMNTVQQYYAEGKPLHNAPFPIIAEDKT